MGNPTTFMTGIAALIAVLVGILKYNPNLLFSIPNGFIFHAITGGQMPPYFDMSLYLRSNDWLKPNDVIVSTAPKSGTTWMLFCSHQIRSKGDDEKFPFEDIMLNTPWPELIQKPGQTWEERRTLMNTTMLTDGTSLKYKWDNPEYPFRIFKSHHVPDSFGELIGGNSKIKFLAMARNGLDQVASAAPFFDKHSDDFRKLWGSFPPADGGSGDKKGEVLSERMQQMLPGSMFGGWYFDYVNHWWKVKDEKNVLLLHYADAKKDLSGTVDKMADFYGVSLSKREKEKVVEKCGFRYMKENTHLFNYQLPLNPDYEGKRIMTNGSMTRKGIVGEGNVIFSDEEKVIWTKAEQEQFGDDLEKLNWARNGSF